MKSKAGVWRPGFRPFIADMEKVLMENRPTYLVVVETDNSGTVSPLSLESLTAAKTAASARNAEVAVLVPGAKVAADVEDLLFHEVDKIYISENQALSAYRPRGYLAVFEKLFNILGPELTVFGNSKNSLDLAARAAIKLDIPLITDCVGIASSGEELLFTKPVYSNNVLATYAGVNSPCIVTLRPKTSAPSERSAKKKGEIIALEAPDENTTDEYEIAETCYQADGETNLADAKIIVTGGRGIGGPEGFDELKKLARLLGGKLGATRPPCDLGWLSADHQIGITGSIVSPDVYIAVGVSGSFQHMAGMSGSKTIIAINSDEKANIFKISNYGIVEEYEEVLPGLIGEISRLSS